MREELEGEKSKAAEYATALAEVPEELKAVRTAWLAEHGKAAEYATFLVQFHEELEAVQGKAEKTDALSWAAVAKTTAPGTSAKPVIGLTMAPGTSARPLAASIEEWAKHRCEA